MKPLITTKRTIDEEKAAGALDWPVQKQIMTKTRRTQQQQEEVTIILLFSFISSFLFFVS
jgi:hypothetical protein